MRWKEIRPHLGFLYDLALRETGRREDAEDVVQEVAASALRAAPELPRAYLAGAVLLRARQLRRGEARRRVRETVLAPPNPPPLPDRAALVRDEVERALSSLEPDDRRAVVLRHLHDLGYDEIGAALGISAAAARQRVHRALSRLRERFGGDGEAALALLPLFVMPRSLAAKPFTGALLMKMTTKAAVALVALAAGAAVGAATAPRATQVAAEAAPPRPPSLPAEDVEGLRAELLKYPPLDDADLLVFADTSLRGKLAAVDGLPEDARREAVRRVCEHVHKAPLPLADDAIALLREENDPRILFWLREVMAFIAYQRVPIEGDVRASLARLAVEGEPAERRRAAVVLSVGTLYQKATPEWEAALAAVFERETDPRVLLEAARALTFVWIEKPGERLLAAYGRMPPGKERREVAIQYRSFGTFAQVVARYDAARDAGEREDWVRVVGYQFGQGAGGDVKAEEGALCRIYPETRDARTRAWLAYSWLGQARPLDPLLPLETDREVRALLERAASLPQEDARRLLKEYLAR